VITGDEPRGLRDEQVAFYLEILVSHGSIFGASICGICDVACCPVWVAAAERLVAANVPIEPW
jgi:hypothetical protein